MIQHGPRLAFGLESRHDFFGVHPKLDDFEGNTATHRFLLVGHIDHTATAFTNLLKKFVVRNLVPRPLGQSSASGADADVHRVLKSCFLTWGSNSGRFEERARFLMRL